MVFCQPALTAKMNNMTVMVRSLVMTSFVYVCQELNVHIYRGSVAHILILGTLQTFRNQLFLLFKYHLIVTQMSWTWSLLAAFTTTACLTRTYAIIFGSYKYELTRAQARISSQLIARLYNGISKSWVALTWESQLIRFTNSCQDHDSDQAWLSLTWLLYR